jgi:hypothetical protein
MAIEKEEDLSLKTVFKIFFYNLYIYVILYHITLHYIILHYIIHYYIVLHCIILHYIILCYITLYYIRAPIALFGGTREVDMKLFPVMDVVDYLKEYAHEVAKYCPFKGFVGVGSMDENWGWLR